MEINLEEFQTLLSQLTSFDKMYEQVRFVDPVKKKSFLLSIKIKKKSFRFWNRVLAFGGRVKYARIVFL